MSFKIPVNGLPSFVSSLPGTSPATTNPHGKQLSTIPSPGLPPAFPPPDVHQLPNLVDSNAVSSPSTNPPSKGPHKPRRRKRPTNLSGTKQYKPIYDISTKAPNTIYLHGSNSKSLITFLDPNLEGKLHPMGTLLELECAPFSGESGNAFDPRSINHKHLSGVTTDQFETTLQYATKDTRMPTTEDADYKERQAAVERYKKSQNTTGKPSKGWRDSMIGLEKSLELPGMRSEYLERLDIDDEEIGMAVKKHLSVEQFPVVYGIKEKEILDGQNFDLPGEVAIKGSVSPKEIDALFVPEKNLKYVKELLGEKYNMIKLIAIEDIDKTPKTGL